MRNVQRLMCKIFAKRNKKKIFFRLQKWKKKKNNECYFSPYWINQLTVSGQLINNFESSKYFQSNLLPTANAEDSRRKECLINCNLQTKRKKILFLIKFHEFIFVSLLRSPAVESLFFCLTQWIANSALTVTECWLHNSSMVLDFKFLAILFGNFLSGRISHYRLINRIPYWPCKVKLVSWKFADSLW